MPAQRSPPWVVNVIRVRTFEETLFTALRALYLKAKQSHRFVFHAAGSIMHHTVAQGLSKSLLVDSCELLSPMDIGSLSATGLSIIGPWPWNFILQAAVWEASCTKRALLILWILASTLSCAFVSKGPGETLCVQVTFCRAGAYKALSSAPPGPKALWPMLWGWAGPLDFQ